PWESRLIYFKVDVSSGQVGKHNVEVEVLEPVAEDLNHINPKARAPMQVSRTTYDPTTKTFVGSCDRGTITVSIKRLTVDYHTFKRSVGRLRELMQSGGVGGGTGSTGTSGSSCSRAELERVRKRLLEFLAGKDVDICGIWRELQCCCSGRGSDGGGGDWTGQGAGDVAMFAFPTLLDYKIDYSPSITGQYGPIPFDDPWWKLLLAIIAILLTIAAFVSAAADLANHSDDVVIGKVERTILNAFKKQSDIPTPITSATPGNVDVAAIKLNGHRTLTSAIFSYKDAASDEENTTPIVSLNGRIDTTGATLTNAQIDQLFQNLSDNPGDPAAQAAMQVFKSGARSGTTPALLGSL